MTLSALFARCVRRDYMSTSAHADYAFDLVGDHLTIYFQDSDGAVDWLSNLNFIAAPYRRDGRSDWYAHRGFLKVWNSLIPHIQPIIDDPSLQSITVVGYSHGAALAVFCHEYIWCRRPDLRETLSGYGFGCPRVLWGHVSEGVLERWNHFTVIRNLPDLVTYVPPGFLGYKHVGIVVEIGEAGKYSAVDAHRAKNIRRELQVYERKNGRHGKLQDVNEKFEKKP